MSFPQPSGTGTVTSLSQGGGVALSPNPIVNSGTVALATIPAGQLFGNPGTAAAIGQGITIGTNLSLSAGGTISATGGGGSSTLTYAATDFSLNATTVDSSAFATKGNLCTFINAGTVETLAFSASTYTNGGQYIAQISALDTLSVAQTVTTSNTVTASGTVGGAMLFQFSPGVSVAAGTTYFLSTSRIDATGTTSVEMLNYGTLSVVRPPAFHAITTEGRVAATRISVGTTIGNTQAFPCAMGTTFIPT